MHISPAILILAFLLDAAIGDPAWLPHPVRIIGLAISKMEAVLRKHFQTPQQEKLGGVFLTASIVGLTFTAALLIQNIILSAPYLKLILVYLVATTIAAKELISSVRKVIESVKAQDIPAARKNLGLIVGRETHSLGERKILTAAMETLAENLSDGVVAPFFYLAIGGLPLALAYKAVNTLDSMVGYKNERYINFGWASARLDDLANYIPARITGGLIAAAAFFIPATSSRHAWAIMLRDGRNHPSPNSGVPEAAMAGALGTRFGGPSTYGGVTMEKPYIGDERTQDYLSAAEHALKVAQVTAVLGMAAVLFLALLKS